MFATYFLRVHYEDRRRTDFSSWTVENVASNEGARWFPLEQGGYWACALCAACLSHRGLLSMSSLQNTRSRGRGLIQIQLLLPYIYLNLPVSTPKPTNLHPLDEDPAPPPGSLFCSEGLLNPCGITSPKCADSSQRRTTPVVWLQGAWSGYTRGPSPLAVHIKHNVNNQVATLKYWLNYMIKGIVLPKTKIL